MSSDQPLMLLTLKWRSDPKLSLCSPATRGIYIDLLCAIHDLDRCGKLSGTPEKLARISRCTPAEFCTAIDELVDTGTADITQRNGIVTVVNRKMSREHKKRETNRIRQERHRENKDLTHLSRDCPSRVREKEKEKVLKEKEKKKEPLSIKESTEPTDLDQMQTYCRTAGLSYVNCQEQLVYWVAGDWHDSKGNEITKKNWRQKLINANKYALQRKTNNRTPAIQSSQPGKYDNL